MAETATDHSATGQPGVVAIGLRLLVFSGLWIALSRGEIAESWYIGLPTVVVAVAASLGLASTVRARLRGRGLLRFVPLFLWRSLVGGVDVALRALRPSMPLAPDLIDYTLRVDADSVAALFFAEVISLLPGTLCAQVCAERIEVHVIDRDLAPVDELEAIEEAIAALFGLPLEPSHEEAR